MNSRWYYNPNIKTIEKLKKDKENINSEIQELKDSYTKMSEENKWYFR